jgi:hypothetical protein
MLTRGIMNIKSKYLSYKKRCKNKGMDFRLSLWKFEYYINKPCFICKKDNLSCLYMPLVFDLQNNREVAFTTEIEKDLNSISLVTGKLYNSYGVKEVQ